MSVARAELVDYLPAGRTRALICQGDEYVLLLRKGTADQQTCDEMTELLQQMLDNERGGHEGPPPPADPSAN